MTNKQQTVRGALLAIALLATMAIAGPVYVDLAWDMHGPDSTITGYKIHYGTSSSNYTETVDVGDVETFRLAGLEIGRTYYIAASCYDAMGLTSDPCAEVSIQVDRPDMVVKFRINAVGVVTANQ